MTFRESINNLIDSSKPQSPTDLVFIFGSLVLLGLQIHATLMQAHVPHFDAMLIALGGYKGVKVASNWQKADKAIKTKEVCTPEVCDDVTKGADNVPPANQQPQ